MKIDHGTNWHVPLVLILVGSVTGCSSAENDGGAQSQGGMKPATDVLPPASFIDEAGTRFVRLKKAKFAEGPLPVPVPEMRETIGANGQRVLTTAVEEGPDVAAMPVEELAAAVRALTLRDGYEYIEESLPLERAQRIKDDYVNGVPVPTTSPFVASSTEVPAGPTVGETDRVDGVIPPNDDRTYRGGNRNFPNSTQLYMVPCGCSATMIGSRMAVSAAHCFYNWSTGTWCNATSFRPAADNGSNPSPYGVLTNFTVTISSSNLSVNDYARIKFGTAVGNTTSWLGTTDSSSGTMEIVGYPGDKPRPQMWGATGTVFETTSTVRKHNVDAVPGESGSALYIQATFLTVGITKSAHSSQSCTFWICGSKKYWNEARRWDGTLYSFFAASGVWPG